jgi:hypothetical protein
MFIWPSNLNYHTKTGYYEYLTNGTYDAGIEEPFVTNCRCKSRSYVHSNHYTSRAMRIIILRQDLQRVCQQRKYRFYCSLDLAWTLFRIGHQYLSPPVDKEGSITSTNFPIDGGTAGGVRGTTGTKFFGNISVAVDATQKITGQVPSSDILDALNQTSDLA